MTEKYARQRFGDKVVENAISLYETDFDKDFRLDLDEEEKTSYYYKSAISLGKYS